MFDFTLEVILKSCFNADSDTGEKSQVTIMDFFSFSMGLYLLNASKLVQSF